MMRVLLVLAWLLAGCVGALAAGPDADSDAQPSTPQAGASSPGPVAPEAPAPSPRMAAPPPASPAPPPAAKPPPARSANGAPKAAAPAGITPDQARLALDVLNDPA